MKSLGECVDGERVPASLPLRGAWIEILPPTRKRRLPRSLPLRGAWIEIVRHIPPHLDQQSLPLRGAWIEIFSADWTTAHEPCRSPYGERGLKSLSPSVLMPLSCRSPYGERGLKCLWQAELVAETPSLPLRGAWIEICGAPRSQRAPEVAPLTGSVD